jgi:hypothetical protein
VLWSLSSIDAFLEKHPLSAFRLLRVCHALELFWRSQEVSALPSFISSFLLFPTGKR